MPRKKQPEKRAYGEGTIFQREDGLWVERKTVTGMDGKRKPATRYGKSRDEVEGKLEKIADSLAAGLIVGTKEQTTKDFPNVWLADVVQQNRAPRRTGITKTRPGDTLSRALGTCRSMRSLHSMCSVCSPP